ncbi:hypothetical protein FQN54_008338 [Arachnomyces sp. PD_36]|nr:hypothetical protein FQN54_008338 [Arachnomyces sp. PD_36]
MAVIKSSPGTSADSVKQAVKSSSTCLPYTVTSLQRLLQSNQQDGSNGADGQPKDAPTTKRTTTSSRSKPAKAVNPRIAAKVAVFQAPTSENEAQLSQQEKLVLATEIFNNASKALSEELKNPTTRCQQQSENYGQRTPSSKRPLQLCSPNKIVASPTKESLGKLSTSKPIGPDGGVAAVAECARIALSSLRTLRGNDPTNVQLEQGSSILIGRLIALGLDDLAYKELRVLKKRIQACLDSQVDSRKKGTRTDQKSKDSQRREASKDGLASLLYFDNVRPDKSVSGLLVSFQAHALKVIAAERKLSTIQKVATTLLSANPNNPATVIIEALGAGALSKEKAAQQLQVLAQTISSLCPSSKPSGSKDTAKYTLFLNLQILSLELRCMWHRISNHNGDEIKEVWEPLARYLGAYSHRFQTIDGEDFRSIKESFLRLKSTAAKHGYKLAKPSDTKTTSTVLKIMGQLAQSAGQIDEALHFYNDSLTALSPDHQLSLGIAYCKIASIHLHRLQNSQCKEPEDAKTPLLEATKFLGSPLKGNMADIEELLVEAAKLKKLAMYFLDTLEDLSSKDSGPQSGYGELGLSIIDYINSFVRLLRRYIGHPPTEDEDPKNYQQFQQKLHRFNNIALAAVDSGIAIGKMAVVAKHPSWDDSLPLLSDCTTILKSLQSKSESESNQTALDNRGIGFVKLSNLYWSRYLKQRELAKSTRELIVLLEQSTALLGSCSTSEKRTGFVAVKLERLAVAYSEIGKEKKSDAAYLQSIQAHVGAGSLRHVSSEASRKPLERIWKDSKGEAFMLGRVINAYTKSRYRRRCDPKDIFFDDTSFTAEERGASLEWQMAALMDISNTDPGDGILYSTMSLIISSLLDIYHPETYPIRRRRVFLHATRFLLNNPNSLPSELIQTIKDEADSLADDLGYSLDSGLAGFAKSISTSFSLSLGFYVGHLGLGELQKIISSWVSIVQNCKDWMSLETQVEDPQNWILQIKTTADYLDMRGFWRLRLSALAVLQHVLELQDEKDYSALVSCLSQQALQYNRLGYSGKAGYLLAHAQHYTEKHDVDFQASIASQLVYAEYLVGVGNIAKSTDALATAEDLFNTYLADHDISRESSPKRISWERLISNATYIQSLIASAKGSTDQAILLAKQSVKLSARIWAKLEKIVDKKREKMAGDDMEMLTDKLQKTELSLSPDDASKPLYNGALFWPHVASHHAVLLNLSQLSAHHGLFRDAIYYGEQALKVSKAVDATSFIAICQVQLGEHWIRGGHTETGQELLDTATDTYQKLEQSLDNVFLSLSKSALCQVQGEAENEFETLDEARQMLGDITSGEFIESLDPFAQHTSLEDSMKQLSIETTTKTRTTTRTRSQRTRKATNETKTAQATKTTVSQPKSTAAECPPLFRLRSEIYRRQAACLLASQNPEKASELLDEAENAGNTKSDLISQRVGRAECLLGNALKILASHAVYCVLPESTLLLPSIHSSSSSSSDDCGDQSQSTSSSITRKAKAPKRGTRARSPVAEADFSELLSKAKGSLGEIFSTTVTSSSTRDNHNISHLFGRLSMLVDATAGQGSGLGSALAATHFSELGRMIAMNREYAVIHADNQTSGDVEPLKWPNNHEQSLRVEPTGWAEFTKDYVDILPDKWSVLSLSMSADHSELIVSKLHAKRTPFLLRLPLKRANSEEDDEEEFTFSDGKSELEEIIKLANSSAHDARARTDKASKKEWWANREALDQRLKELLDTIESVWLGGFRGIFSQRIRNSALISRFSNAFERILDKHLPSRQKGGKNKSPRVNLHQNVIELFLGLGDLKDTQDPEEGLMDLLYFVVDILQFNGERNAYDEIDFDMIVVDTLDALQSCFDAARRNGTTEEPNHTILVLDKTLHAFPWESLPCLQGMPVSRMPSLRCLRERILKMRSEDVKGSYPGVHIDRNKGSYILNPGGDLKSTQKAFEKSLSGLDNWRGIVQREPEEEEFKRSLASDDLFLYFGHGSGAQYIRGRTIRRLERCAVTFLMGCSSGSLTETGEYEPYGTPINYIHAGTPALVSTLWDVTDKDIDRFAMSVFGKWGLVEGEDIPEPSKQRKGIKGKKSSQVAEDGLKTSLDESIARSRDACFLKYLNGAAVVVYGVPVFLD